MVEGGSFRNIFPRSRRLTATQGALDIRFEANADIRKSGCGFGSGCILRLLSLGCYPTRTTVATPVVIPISVPIPNPGNIIQHLVEHRPREVEPGGEAGERGGEVGSVCGLLN